MKVLFLSENPHTHIGGIENHITYIGKILEEKKGYSVAYLSAKELASRTIIDKQMVPMKKIKKNIISIAPDVIHVHGFSSFFVYQCLSVVKKTVPNVKLVYTPHYHPFQYHNRPLLAAAFFHVFLKRSLKNIDILIALTEAEKDFFAQYVEEHKIHIVPNGIDSNHHMTEKEKPSSPSLLFIGRDDHNKRLDFIEMQREFFKEKGIKCHIVTDKEKNFDEVFVYYKNLSDSQLQALYEKCTLLSVPSKYEAFSIVALEAMSYGMPILISDRVQIKSYIVDGGECNQVFRYDDSRDFQNKLGKILKKDKVSYKHCSQNNILFAQKFSWQEIAKKVETLYGLMGEI